MDVLFPLSIFRPFHRMETFCAYKSTNPVPHHKVDASNETGGKVAYSTILLTETTGSVKSNRFKRTNNALSCRK